MAERWLRDPPSHFHNSAPLPNALGERGFGPVNSAGAEKTKAAGALPSCYYWLLARYLAMSVGSHPVLEAHLRRHVRMLHRIACGLGRQRDADDIIQILYSRWWRRIGRDPDWTPPNESSALFVCVKRVVIDEVDKERRRRARHEHVAHQVRPPRPAPDERLHAFERLRWILARLPAALAESLTASLSAGRHNDASVAEELGISRAAYTARLFKARRAAEQLTNYYDLLPLDQANLMAELSYSGKTRAQVAHELNLLVSELNDRRQQALDMLAQDERAVAQ